MSDEFKPAWDPKRHEEVIGKNEVTQFDWQCRNCSQTGFFPVGEITVVDTHDTRGIRLNANRFVCVQCGTPISLKEIVDARKGPNLQVIKPTSKSTQ